MRSTPRTSLPYLGLSLAVLGASAALAAFSGCADALHLDPPGTLAPVDGGAEGGTACRSNPDCAYPKPVCDTVAETCVECLVISDCAGKPGTVCSRGACTCPSADPTTPLTYCASPAPSCVDTSSDVNNCGGCGTACFGSCSAGKCPNAWSPTATTGAPEARSHHVALWTGTQMFVWGGKDGGKALDDGALYDPVKKTWKAVSKASFLPARWDATAVWDDSEGVIVVWGGADGSGPVGTGGVYDPTKDTWKPMTMAGAPAARTGHTAVWAKPLSGAGFPSAGMIIWGGTIAGGQETGDGAVYDVSKDMWLGPIDTGATPRTGHIAVWDSGSRMIVFGGMAHTMGPPVTLAVLGDAYAYNPSQNGVGTTWNTLMGAGTPTARTGHTAVWDPTTKTTLVFGGWDLMNYFGDGDALSGTSWSTLGSGGSTPDGRVGHSMVIVPAGGSSQLIVFGGDQGAGKILDTGWVLDTKTNAWSALPTPGPSGRTNHTAVAAGSTMIVWGGDGPGGAATNTGAVYNAGP